MNSTIAQLILEKVDDDITKHNLRNTCKLFRDLSQLLEFDHNLVKEAEDAKCSMDDINELKNSYKYYIRDVNHQNIILRLRKLIKYTHCKVEDETLFRNKDWKRNAKSYLMILSEIPFPFGYDEKKIDIILDLIESQNSFTLYGALEQLDGIFCGNWIYDNCVEICQDKTIHPILKKWCENFKDTNFYPISSLIENIFMHGLTNYGFLGNLLNSSEETNLRQLEFNKEQYIDYHKKIKMIISLKKRSRSDLFEEYLDKVKKGNFDIYPDSLSKQCCESMFRAIHRIGPEAMEWFRVDGKVDSNNPMLRKLSRDKKVEECGHTGASMSWTLAQFRCFYQEGPNKLVDLILANYLENREEKN